MLLQVLVPDPSVNVHAHAFDEVVEALFGGLSRLGVDVRLSHAYLGPTAPALVVAPHLHSDELLSALPDDSLMYCFEPLSGHGAALMPEHFRELLARCIIWDYSTRNVEQWRADGASRVLHVPLGYDPVLAHLPGPGEPDCDVLFYGSLSDRRVRVLNDLRDAGLRVKVMFGAYGPTRDQAIAEAKVVLNLHQNAGGILELPRLAYLWANSVPVVWEHNETTEDSIGIGRLDAGYPYDQLVSACATFVADGSLRVASAAATRQRFMDLPHEADILLAALETSAGMSSG